MFLCVFRCPAFLVGQLIREKGSTYEILRITTLNEKGDESYGTVYYVSTELYFVMGEGMDHCVVALNVIINMYSTSLSIHFH